jgi:predicted nucleotidyltransferase
MVKNDSINRIKRIIVPILKRNDVVKAGIFGSYARGEQKKRSDLDLLIKFKGKNKSLLDLIGLKQELEEKTKKKVDLVEYSIIRSILKERILSEEVKIL